MKTKLSREYKFTIKFFIAIFFIASSCQQNRNVRVPDTKWDLFESPKAIALDETMRKKMEGVYSLADEKKEFGEMAVLKWSYTVNGKDTSFHLSMFCEKDKSYFICEGKRLDSSILLNGFWRQMVNDETGKAHFTISPNIAKNILNGSAAGDTLIIEGNYGDDEEEPKTKITLTFMKRLEKKKDFEILAHRGGGRITDFIPASENSVELIRLASRFGATGVEIDVQLTKDGIPVLYHDANISDRLTNKTGFQKPLHDYTYAELTDDVKLKKGEKIPTLREALETIVYQTPLEFVWLDVKEKNVLQQAISLRQEFEQAALANGRKLKIAIGIPDKEVYQAFLLVPGHENILSICELDPATLPAINANIWAALWTKGLQAEDVTSIHNQHRKAFVWTVDRSEKVREFIEQGGFDGMVSNFPSAVAFYYYISK